MKLNNRGGVSANELTSIFEVCPLVIWNYNPSLGEMNREELIRDLEYYEANFPYKLHEYDHREEVIINFSEREGR